jgi:integrase
VAIIKRSNGTYQVKYRGSDGRWISKTFRTKREAETEEARLKQEKRGGGLITNHASTLLLDEFFDLWLETIKGQASSGWLSIRRQQYRDFVKPFLGSRKLAMIQPVDIALVFTRMVEANRAAATRLHVYTLLRRLFRDAEETFRLITHNPVLRTYKPSVPTKEAPHLNLEQVRKLLLYVQDKPYGTAIWLHFFLGLRVGELQALRCQDVDLDSGVVRIRGTYVKMEREFRDYPKGKKQHWKPIPPELVPVLAKILQGKAPEELLVRSAEWPMLSYEWYNRSLRRYCKAIGLPVIGTHGLRHSTSGLYLSGGASRDQIRALLAHSSERVTERYVHHHDSTLGKLAEVIRLFPDRSQYECSQNVPKSSERETSVQEVEA